MQSWSVPGVPALPAHPDTLRVHDTATGMLRRPGNPQGSASLYVCGITPYDATHLGHANTYVAVARSRSGSSTSVTFCV